MAKNEKGDSQRAAFTIAVRRASSLDEKLAMLFRAPAANPTFDFAHAGFLCQRLGVFARSMHQFSLFAASIPLNPLFRFQNFSNEWILACAILGFEWVTLDVDVFSQQVFQ